MHYQHILNNLVETNVIFSCKILKLLVGKDN
jgi:hypothetical protein